MSHHRILLITQYFHPESFRGNDIAFHLAKEGHKVHVVTAVPNYPAGEFYPGYGLFKRRHELVDGVEITRLPVVPRGHSKLMLMLNYFSFMVVGWIYILFHAMFHKYDMVFCQQLSPVMMSAPAVLYKKLRRVPLYTWVLDLWPDVFKTLTGIDNKMVTGLLGHFSAQEYKWSDKILISSKSFEDSILRYGDYAHKIVPFPQWSTSDPVAEQPSVAPVDLGTDESDFVVMFAGTVGEAQGFECNLRAALLTREHRDIKWVIVGEGRKLDWVKQFVAANGLEDTVRTVGFYPPQMMPSLYAKADVLLATLDDSPLFSLYLPAKITSYMSASKPIVACMNGEGARVVREASCGWCVPAGDAEGLAALLIHLSQADAAELYAAGAAGRRFYDEHFDREKCLEKLEGMMGV